MIKIDLDYNDELLQRKIRRFPALMQRATNSTLSGLGYEISRELKDYMESGYVEGPPLHPFTLGYKQRVTKQGKMVLAKRRAHGGPLSWLGKFARYAVWGEGQNTTLAVGLSKGKARGKLTSPEQLDSPYIRKHEFGRRVRVSAEMRRLFGAMGFPLKKTTSYVTIPRRPTISVSRQRVQGQVQERFKEKFIERLRRYQLEAQ